MSNDCPDFVPSKPGVPIWGTQKCAECGIEKRIHPGGVVPFQKDSSVRHSNSLDETSSSTSNNSSTSSSGGYKSKSMGWFGSKEKEKPPEKPKEATIGTTPGSLASFMGSALGIKHKGDSHGFTKNRSDEDEEKARMFHANREANKEMAQMLAGIVKQSKEGPVDEKNRALNLLQKKTRSEPS